MYPARSMLRTHPLLSCLAACLMGFCAARAAVGAELAGTVELVEGGRPIPDAASAIVWFEPAGGAAKPDPTRAVVNTKDRRFTPRVTKVPVGSEVVFPNGDPIIHNVFSVSRGNRFDLGRYKTGPGKSTTFLTPGLVRVYCNVHESMVAYVLVLDTPYSSSPDNDGRFRLEGLPSGKGTLYVWHERTGPWSRDVLLPLSEPLVVHLDAQPVPTNHLNKFGRPYADTDHDSYH
jgi:plastocyanin